MPPVAGGGFGALGFGAAGLVVGAAGVVAGRSGVASGVVGSGVLDSGVVTSWVVVGSVVVGSVLVGSVVVGGALEAGVLDRVDDAAADGDVGAEEELARAGSDEAEVAEADGTAGALEDAPGSPGTVTAGALLSTDVLDAAVVLPATPPVGWADVPVPHEASTVTAATAQARTANDFGTRM